MSDNVKARIMQNDGTYIHAEPTEGEAPLNAQEYFYEEAYKKATARKQRQEQLKNTRKSS
jgi:polyphosphate kinase